ncbi:MAG: ATP-dependent sacrificial sulfur transferase LarE [Candidatus Gastranaerophilales bacterium]|nr:ATP-dependent sacrificial sulfur transferase LarE [Candidatus Gastranaerophilales bacterium]
MDINEKLQNLKENIKSLNSAVITFSAGVDSTLLLKIASEVLDDKVLAVTVNLNSFPERELNEAINFCQQLSIRHRIIDFDEFSVEGFAKNPVNRCYLCKKALFSKIREIAEENNIKNILEGSNTDDTKDYRPGFQAVKELKIISPFLEVGLSKKEIRFLSKEYGLSVWEKPSFACLASRFPYGDEITKEKLSMVEKSEQLLFDLGFTQFRVRIHGSIARIEVFEKEFDKLLQNRQTITEKLKTYGFEFVTMDLSGYKTGSLNTNVLQYP